MATGVGEPIKIRLEDGSVIEGATAEEALANAAKRIQDNQAAYKAEKAAREAAEQRTIAFQQAEQLRTQEVERQKRIQQNGGFDQTQYYNLLNSDPLAAFDYAFEHRFQRKPQQVMQDFEAVTSKVSVFEQKAAAAEFIATHPDFPTTDKNAARLMNERVSALIGQGHPFTLDTMGIAFSNLVNEGAITLIEKTPEPEPEPPNPSLGGGGANVTEAEMQKADSMTDAQLEALLRSKGMLQ